jgi:hypothetical protein
MTMTACVAALSGAGLTIVCCASCRDVNRDQWLFCRSEIAFLRLAMNVFSRKLHCEAQPLLG